MHHAHTPPCWMCGACLSDDSHTLYLHNFNAGDDNIVLHAVLLAFLQGPEVGHLQPLSKQLVQRKGCGSLIIEWRNRCDVIARESVWEVSELFNTTDYGILEFWQVYHSIFTYTHAVSQVDGHEHVWRGAHFTVDAEQYCKLACNIQMTTEHDVEVVCQCSVA